MDCRASVEARNDGVFFSVIAERQRIAAPLSRLAMTVFSFPSSRGALDGAAIRLQRYASSFCFTSWFNMAGFALPCDARIV